MRSTITIDLLVKGLEKIERIGAVLGSLIMNRKFTDGFTVLYNALGSVSVGAQKALGSLGKFAVLISALSTNPQFVAFAKAVAEALKLISKELDASSNKTKKNKDALTQLSLAMGIISILIRSVGFLIRDLGLNLLRTSQRITAFFKKLVDAGGDIEQKFSELQALLSAPTQASESFQKLTQEIIRVGESSSQTISQVAGLANELARAGFNTEEITASIGSVVQLSEAAGISAEDAARIASNVKTMFSLQASELSRVNDVLTATANASTSSVQSLGESFTYVGPLAASFGFSVEEIAAALGVLANAGQRGSVAGAGLQQMFSQLIAHADDVDAVMKRHGSSFEAVNPEIHSVTEIMAEFNRVNLSSAEIISIFSERARKTFLALNSQGIETLRLFEDLNRSSAGMAKNIAETRMDNLSGDILRLKSAFEALQYEVFEAIKDQLETFVEWITKLIQSMRSFVKENKKMVAGLADFAKTVALTTGGFAGLTLALSSVTRFAGLLSGGLATVLATVTMLGPHVKTGTTAFLGFGKNLLTALFSITKLKTGLASIAVVLKSTLKYVLLFSTSLLAFTGIAGVVAAAVYGIISNWEFFSGVLQDFYDNTWLPFYYGFMHGFMEGYNDYVKPAIDSLVVAFSSLIASFSNLFGDDAPAYDNFKNFGNLAAYIATGFIYAFQGVIKIIEKTVDMSKSLADAYAYVRDGILSQLPGGETPEQLLAQLPSLPGGQRPTLEQSLTPEAQIERYKQQIRELAVGHNDLMKGVVDTSVGLDKIIPQYEKAASMLSRITELKPNELTELENTLSGIRDLGKDFDLQSVSTAFNDVQGEIDKLQAHRDKLSQFQKSGGFETALGMLGVGEQGASAAMKVVENMVSQSDKMLEDLVKKRDKLAASKENMRLIDILAGAGGFEQFQTDRAAMKAELDAIASDVEKKSLKLAKLKSSVGWMSTGATNEEERQQKIKELELSLSAAQSKAQGLTEALGMMGSISNESMFNTLREGLFFGADTFGDPVIGLIEALKRLREEELNAEKAAKAWEEAQKGLNDTLDESTSKVEQLRREIALTAMDSQSKEEMQVKLKTEDALKELDALQLKLQETRDKAIAAGLDASSPEVQAIDKHLADITQTRIDFAAHGANEINKIQNEADDKRKEDLIDMELSLAKDKKDQAKEVALTQQKWNKETLEKLEKDYTEVDANGVKRMRAGADEFKKLRAEQLQQQLDDINNRYEEEQKKEAQSDQKRPVDRAKEMVDIQNEAYQILLKKVNTTRDLFALERALLKIQEMQLANALKLSSRAVRAETSVEMAKKRHEEALLRGDDPLKTQEALKKAQERAGIIRGASDLRNRQMGIGTSDVNAMNVASAAMDATSQMVLQRIGDKMRVIAEAMNGMTATFSSIAEGWINAFIESWDKNSSRLQETVMRTLSQLQIGLNTSALGNPTLSAATTASGAGLAAATPGGSTVVNNFQVNATDPMEAGKKMARLIDQSTRDI